jgi:putative DNA methylase
MSLSFIETQFPVSRLSKESYKERKANYSQTLTGLGKWWGRKPLILCRATILGLLLPATDDPEADRSCFLALLTMDEDGLLRRFKGFQAKEMLELATPDEAAEYETKRAASVAPDASPMEKVRLKAEFQNFRADLERRIFLRLPYDQQIAFCHRPENIDGPSPAAWEMINAHLGTAAGSIPELVRELGQRRFGRVPRVGDAFCGGGSIPFEAARIGCEAHASDLNPVAALLTWAALNIVGGGPEVAEKVRAAQAEIYAAVDAQVTAWGIEHKTEDLQPGEWEKLLAERTASLQTRMRKERQRSAASAASTLSHLSLASLETRGPFPDSHHLATRVWRADAYLYCVEVRCPETGWLVPLAPSWVIGEKTNTIATLVPLREEKRYRIDIKSAASPAEMKAAKLGTIRKGRIIHPVLEELGLDPASIDSVRTAGHGKDPSLHHANGLRLWENDDLVPRPDDVFQERLYCVRWIETRIDKKSGNPRTTKHYRSITKHDLAREQLALDLLRERFGDWQEKGFIPSMKIEAGVETERLQRERGWTQWHHLFNPRHLLIHGLVTKIADSDQAADLPMPVRIANLLWIGSLANKDSKLSVWNVSSGVETSVQVFSNLSLNTISNWAAKNSLSVDTSVPCSGNDLTKVFNIGSIDTKDARGGASRTETCEFWLTDPPYADAVNYHEVSEFFLAWLETPIKKLFPCWPAVARKALAVKGSDDNFRRSMVDCYRNLAEHMPDDGMQVVMFTHQDAAVWADLALILWASGLHVTAAWCIATEADSALKVGNYVQGTVLLVLRKQTGEDTAFLDEVYPEVEAEVKRQLDSMHELDDPHADAPDFTDTDYQLAAYAAALRVLTRYRSIEDIDVARELARPKGKRAERSPLEAAIAEAVKIACDHLVPAGIDRPLWKALGPAERFYLKGLDLESRGEFRSGAYQELARGFGVRDYTALLGNDKANEVRLMTATEFGKKLLRAGEDAFSESLLRHTLFAIREVAKSDQGSEPGRAWLKAEVENYWSHRKTLIAILQYLSRFQHSLPTWEQDAKSAALLAGALENDH